MAQRRSFKKVPLFSNFKLKLAELCANDLWSGINYENGKRISISDEELLVLFAEPFYKLVIKPNSKNLIKEQSIRKLIRVAKIKALFRSANPTNFKKGIVGIKKNIIPIYKQWKSIKNPPQPIYYETNAILTLGKDFVKQQKKVTRNGNFRVPLASRILFFAIPNMSFFNFSNSLAKKMLFQSRPQAAIPFFMDILDKGFHLNSYLKKMKLPPPSFLKPNLYRMIYKSDWWQRRVLDLALLIHFRIFKVRKELIKQARSIILSKRKKINY